MVKVDSQKKINKKLTKLPGVWKAVDMQARSIGKRAEARLAGHRRTGQARIEVELGGYRHDSWVWLIDPAAGSIEWGHIHNFSGEYVEGLYIITGAAGLLGGR